MNVVVSKSLLPFVRDHVRVVPAPFEAPPAFALPHQKHAGYEQIKTGWPLPGWRTAPLHSRINAKLMSLILHALDQEGSKEIDSSNAAEHRRAAVERFVATGKRHVFAGTTLQAHEVRLLKQLFLNKCCAPGSDFLEGTRAQVRQRVLDDLQADSLGGRLAQGQFGVAERSFKVFVKQMQKSKDTDISSVVHRGPGHHSRLITDANVARLTARNERALSAGLGIASRELIREIRSYAKYAL